MFSPTSSALPNCSTSQRPSGCRTAATLAPSSSRVSETDVSAPPNSCTRNSVAKIPAARRSARQRVERAPRNRRRERDRRTLEAQAVAGAPDRDGAGPGIGKDRKPRQHRRLARPRASADRAPSACTGPIGAGTSAARRRGTASGSSKTSGLIVRAATRRLSVSTVSRISKRCRRPDTVSPTTSPGVSASRLGGNAKSALSRPAHRSCSHDLGAPDGDAVICHHCDIGAHAAFRNAGQPARRGRGTPIVRPDIQKADRDFARQFGFLRAHQPNRRGILGQHQIVFAELRHRRAAARTKRQHCRHARRHRRRSSAPGARSPRARTSAGRSHSRPAPRPMRLHRSRSRRCVAAIAETSPSQSAPNRAAPSANGRSPSSARRSTRPLPRERRDRAAHPRSTDKERTDSTIGPS